MSKLPEWTNTETLLETTTHPKGEAWVEEHENPETKERIFAALDMSGCDSGVIGVYDSYEEASNAVGEQEGFSDLWIKL